VLCPTLIQNRIGDKMADLPANHGGRVHHGRQADLACALLELSNGRRAIQEVQLNGDFAFVKIKIDASPLESFDLFEVFGVAGRNLVPEDEEATIQFTRCQGLGTRHSGDHATRNEGHDPQRRRTKAEDGERAHHDGSHQS
jgi:hypothetical protein